MSAGLTESGLVRDGALATVRQTEDGASVFVAGDLRPDELRHVSRLTHEAAVNAEKRVAALPAVVSPAGCA